jgi:hypothetical protein
MLSKKISNWLEENESELLPEYQEKYKRFLVANSYDKDTSFVEFMSKYSDEILGSEGHLFDVVGDLMDYTPSSVNYQMHTQDKVPTNYIALTDNITEFYLLYDRNNGTVVTVEGANLPRLLAGKFDRKWENFNDFLAEFLGIDD